jgi:alpha-L-rhamnosidase
MSEPAVAGLRAEYEHASFVPVTRPRLSWQVQTDEPNWVQSFAEVEYTHGAISTTHRVDGSESVFVEWPFEALAPRSRGHVRVRVRVAGPDRSPGEWSAPLLLRAGFLGEGEWRASFIALAEPDARAEPFLARRRFAVRPGLRAATLYATAQGTYQAEINGAPVDAQILKPGWTPYDSRLIHETTDVTDWLVEGSNVIGATVAGGWFTEIYGFREGASAVYGEQPAFAAQLVLEYSDGAIEHVVTDGFWRTSAGPIVESGLYVGERVDARRAIAGWSTSSSDDSTWAAAALQPMEVVPQPRTSPIVTEIERRAVAEVITSPSGALILDFGQNLVGRLEIQVSAPAGHEITLRHAEVLEHGELSVRPLRRALSIDHYTAAGSGTETWQPQFTFHGFRYAEIAGWPGEFDPSAVTAVVIHSDMPRTGWFRSSNELINRFHESVVWGMRGNFLYLPTDCPQRDERLGWLGDIQAFAPTASYLFDANGLLASWLVDLGIEQRAAGGVPFIVPNVLESARVPAAAWGDAATIVPWTLYERFGDIGVLRTQFESMRDWVDQVLALAGPRRLWEGGFQFGDWLDPTAPVDRPADAKTSPDLVASAYLYRSTRIVSDTASLLGDTGTAARYSAIADEVRAAWRREYVTAAGRVLSDSQAAYALAIMFDLATEEGRVEAGARLAELVRRSGYRIQTGFVGTPLVQDALVRTGHAATAARLMLQTELPSWLYPVTMGATTVWERWDSILEDGTVNPGEMTSFNHYALGAVADWLHRVLAGLAPAAPGYRELLIAPTPLPGFDSAEAEHLTPYGRARSAWRLVEGELVVEATVPPNTSAQVRLPDGRQLTVGSGSHEWRMPFAYPAAVLTDDLGLDTPLSVIIDDPECYATVVQAIATVSPAISESFRTGTVWTAGQTLRTATIDTPATVFAAMTEALQQLNARRRG